MLGFVIFPCFIMDAVLMPDLRDDFNLHIFTDRAVTLSGTSFSLGGLFGYFPIAVGMVCHIQLFTAGAFLPVLGFVIFPFFVVNIVRMNRQRLCLRIFADGAGALSGTCFGCGGLLCYRPIIEGVVGYIKLFPAGTQSPMLGVVLFPFVVMTVLMNRQGFSILVVTSGAGALSGTCFGCGRLLCYRPIIESMVAHFSFLAAAAFLPVLDFILLPVVVAVLMFKLWNGFGLNMVADRAVTCFGASLGFGSRLRHSPFAVDMVCHIQLFTTGTLLPVISIIIFPCFIVNIVRMNRQRLCLRIFADGAGAFS